MARVAQRFEEFCSRLDNAEDRRPATYDRLSDLRCVAIIVPAPRALSALTALVGATSVLACARRTAFRTRVQKRGQVAQVVERSPEKAGVGGSTPSLATILIASCFNHINRLCNFVLFLICR